jgi:hypothetical protein
LAIPFTAWAFYSGRGRIVASIAYVIVLAVATLLFLASMAFSSHPSQSGSVDPMAYIFAALFTGTFILVVVLGIYGVASGIAAWRRRHRMPDAT